MALTQKQVSDWRNPNKGLQEVKKRIRKILSEAKIAGSTVYPSGYCVDGNHEFSFEIRTKDGAIKGVVNVRV